MTVEKIKMAIYSWGIYPALILLREEQENENYELCNVIKQAIDEIGEKVNWNITSKVDNYNLKTVYENILNDIPFKIKDPSFIDRNMPFYIEEFKNSVFGNKPRMHE